MAEETEDVEEHIEVFNDIELQRKSFAEQITDEFAPYETKINAWIGEASRIKVHSIEDEEAMAKAGLPVAGPHSLRHTFCSHLAMRGAPARAIQELAGHSELGVTQRYMHLSPAALDAAIQLLDGRGNGLATRATGTAEA